MQAIHVENVQWKNLDRGVREAEVFAETHGALQTRIDLVEVPPGSYIPPHRRRQCREFFTIVHSAGAQLQLGERIFRPTTGQLFHREPEDVMALTNDTPHPFRYTVTRFLYQADDIEWLSDAETTAS